MSKLSFDNGATAPFSQARQNFEQACARHIEFIEHGFTGDHVHYWNESYRLETAYSAAQAEMLATPAQSVSDIAYKLNLSIGEADEIGEDIQTLALLRRGLMALQSGSVTTARILVDKALDGETNYECIYEGAVSALADLKRISAERQS